MKKFIVFLIVLFNLNSFSQTESKGIKIGVCFEMRGPYRFKREAMQGTVTEFNNDDPSDPYYDAIEFFKTEKVNPTNILLKNYLDNLKLNGFNPIIINEKLDKINFPDYKSQRNKFYPKDLSYLKKQYDLDYVLIIYGDYGFEFERIGVIGGDKRTHITLYNSFANVNSNEIIEKFRVTDIKNIKKKNLLSPPDYPNIVESMGRLLNERILPELKDKVGSYVIITTE